MTVDQIKNATGSTTRNAERFLAHIIATCCLYDIATPKRQLAFLSQVGHESAGLFYTEELASGAAYEGRADLGNIKAGDGIKYKGRGLIQITGRANYKAVGTALGIDLINNPTLLGASNATKCSDQQLLYAAESAGWYWNSRKLNDLADKLDISLPVDRYNNYNTFVAITKKINGGTNGLADRIKKFKAGVPFFV